MNSVKASAYHKSRSQYNKRILNRENKYKTINLINELIGKWEDLSAIVLKVSDSLKRRISEKELESMYHIISGGYLYTELDWATAIKKDIK